MSAITPQTELRLLKCPLEEDNKHQLTFASAEAQYNYFNGLTNITADNFTYQRKDSIIRFPEHIDNLIGYNYVMYQNEAYTNKWFYAFITNMEYVNDHMTNITIKTDCFQTWQFDIVYKKSFVEREHVNDDTIGYNTIDEGLDTGSYVCNNVSEITIGTGDLICCLCSDFPPIMAQYFKKSKYNSIYSGGKAIAFVGVQDASNFVAYMEAQQKGDAIISFFILPNSIISGDLTFITRMLDVDPAIFGVNQVEVSFSPIPESVGETWMGSMTVTNLTDINGYTPKNNKLFTGKYNYFYITNNAGAEADFHYEDFVDRTPTFDLIGAFAQGGSMKLIPKNYLKHADTNSSKYFYNYGITGPKYPICSWTSDSYTSWLAENSLNIGFRKAGATIGIIGGGILMATGVGGALGGGLLASGLGMAVTSMKENFQHSRMSDQAQGNVNSGEVQYASGKTCYTLYKMTIKVEYAKIIDDFFSTYGYKVNDVKLPNVTGRTTWNYVKTIDCNLEGNIPQADIDELKKMFNVGVTFWHSTTNFLNYSATNTIVT